MLFNKGDVLMERVINTKIGGVDYAFTVYDTDCTPLRDLMKKDIAWAYKWDDYYVFKIKTEDSYDAQVYLVNEKTKKVEWGYYTSLGFAAEENGKSITLEDLKRAMK